MACGKSPVFGAQLTQEYLPMIELHFDLAGFKRVAAELDGGLQQLPFALSVALNEAAKVTRQRLISDTWPRHVEARRPQFIRAALSTKFSTKRDLEVVIFDKLGRAHLQLHAVGGTKLAKGRLAIPTRAVVRTPTGVRKSQRPTNLRNKVVKGGLIFQRVGRGKNSKLRLMYKLQPSARQPKDVPFYEDFARFMTEQMRMSFPAAMARALKSRRR